MLSKEESGGPAFTMWSRPAVHFPGGEEGEPWRLLPCGFMNLEMG
jgi:hypothetical protein